ncbi:RidA family protein [Chloroflexota bacterium]
MELKRPKLYYGGKLQAFAKGTVVRGAKGFVFLSGTEGIKDVAEAEVAEGIEAQTIMCLEKIKSRLEEMGSSLDNIVKIIWYIKGPRFPSGVRNSPSWQKASKVIQEFWQEYCPDFCSDQNPPASDLIGVSGLALEDMLIEIAATAIIPDD